MAKILKTIIIIFLTIIIFAMNIAAEENILNRLFFEDFENLGSSVTESPLKSLIITIILAGTTISLMNNDKYISTEIQKNKNSTKDQFFNIFNDCGDGLYILAADSILFAVGSEKERKVGKRIIEGIAVSGMVAYITKIIVGRERPSNANTQFNYKPFSLSDSSLPSGHTTAAFAWATILGDNYNIGYITYPIAFLCGIARIYKNAHWPSDVLLGGFIGTITGKVINFENPNMQISYENKDNLNFLTLNFGF